jgi:preprotein translocase subunit SecE
MAVVESNEVSTGVQPVTAAPNKLMQFLHDTRQEMTKVVTPSPSEVKSTTIVVLVTVFLFAAYFELVDLVLGSGIDKMFVALTKH